MIRVLLAPFFAIQYTYIIYDHNYIPFSCHFVQQTKNWKALIYRKILVFCYCRNPNFLWSHCKNLWLMICNFLLILADAWWQFFVSTKPALHLPQWTICKSISWKIVNFRHTKWNIEAFLLIKVNHKILHVFYDLSSIFRCRRFGSF